MGDVQEPDETTEELGEGSSERKYARSAIEFPYGDLESAIAIAKILHDKVGISPCSPEQMAAFLGLTPNSGGFRARIAPARIFGLIETERGKITLSILGRDIVDPSQEKSARIKSFLNVQLYRALFERYKSALLPGVTGLENEIERLGVSPKQKDKARQVFERSADQAGFRAHGKDRLVMPVLSTADSGRGERSTPLDSLDEGSKNPAAAPPVSAPQLPTLHPFIEGLLRTLPVPDSEWKVADRAKWLQTAASIFSLIYKGDGAIDVRVNVSGQTSAT